MVSPSLFVASPGYHLLPRRGNDFARRAFLVQLFEQVRRRRNLACPVVRLGLRAQFGALIPIAPISLKGLSIGRKRHRQRA